MNIGFDSISLELNKWLENNPGDWQEGKPITLKAEEAVTDKDYFDAMINPRLAALAEIAWSSKAKRTWSQFRSSLLHNVDFLSNLGWKFHNF